jgi:hypothetical protein
MGSLDSAQERWDARDEYHDEEHSARRCEVCNRRGAPWSGSRMMYVCHGCGPITTDDDDTEGESE